MADLVSAISDDTNIGCHRNGRYKIGHYGTSASGLLSQCFDHGGVAALRHGQVFFFTQTADNGTNTESSFQTGYDFAANSTVTITIGDEEFRMLTAGSNAWLEKIERDMHRDFWMSAEEAVAYGLAGKIVRQEREVPAA